MSLTCNSRQVDFVTLNNWLSMSRSTVWNTDVKLVQFSELVVESYTNRPVILRIRIIYGV